MCGISYGEPSIDLVALVSDRCALRYETLSEEVFQGLSLLFTREALATKPVRDIRKGAVAFTDRIQDAIRQSLGTRTLSPLREQWASQVDTLQAKRLRGE